MFKGLQKLIKKRSFANPNPYTRLGLTSKGTIRDSREDKYRNKKYINNAKKNVKKKLVELRQIMIIDDDHFRFINNDSDSESTLQLIKEKIKEKIQTEIDPLNVESDTLRPLVMINEYISKCSCLHDMIRVFNNHENDYLFCNNEIKKFGENISIKNKDETVNKILNELDTKLFNKILEYPKLKNDLTTNIENVKKNINDINNTTPLLIIYNKLFRNHINGTNFLHYSVNIEANELKQICSTIISSIDNIISQYNTNGGKRRRKTKSRKSKKTRRTRRRRRHTRKR